MTEFKHKFKIGDLVKTYEGIQGQITFCYYLENKYKVSQINGFVVEHKEEDLELLYKLRNGEENN